MITDGGVDTPSTSLNNGKHVYVVDDDRRVRMALVRVLEQHGYDVHHFDGAKDFLEQAFVFRPAVLVLDMQMPGLSGVELQARLKEQGMQMPAIFISGESSVGQGVMAMKQGALDFLTKPFEFGRLLALIELALAQDLQKRQALALKQLRSKQLLQLKPREQEAFFCLAKGYSYAETMRVMQISLPTAKQYRAAVMRSLNFESLSDLLQFHRDLTDPDL